MKRILFLLFILGGTCLSAQISSGQAKKWRKDLRILQEQLAARHVDLYHSISKDSFDWEVDILYDNIPTMAEPEILVGIAQIIAKVGDGHTSFYPGTQRKKWFGFFPIKLWAFSDGIYVIATTKAHADVFGKRLVKIENTPIEKAFELVSTCVAADNDMEYQYTFPFQLNRPEMLQTLGIIASAEKAVFVFEDNIQKTFHRLPLKKWIDLEWISANSLYEGQKPPSMRLDFLFASPLTIEHLKQKKYYWFTYIAEHKALYFQYNTCWDQKNRPSFAETTKELFNHLDSLPVERLIFDIRQNSGGEPLIAQPLIDGLAERQAFIEEGRLFVLVGRRTYSAALTNAAHLRSKTMARTVGEPPRGKPNHPSEGRDIILKRTKIWVSVSTQFVERDPGLGNAPYLPIDIPAVYSFEAYQKADDPVLQAALEAEVFN